MILVSTSRQWQARLTFLTGAGLAAAGLLLVAALPVGLVPALPLVAAVVLADCEGGQGR